MTRTMLAINIQTTQVPIARYAFYLQLPVFGFEPPYWLIDGEW